MVPFGRHARPHRWWIPVRVLLALFAVVFALSVVQHDPCLRTNWGDDQARYGKACYSDIPYLYTGRGFAEALWPYADNDGRYQVMEYPVGISYLAWVTAKVTQINPVGSAGRGAAPPGPRRDVVAAGDDQGGQQLLPGQRALPRRVRVARDLVHGRSPPAAAVGRLALRALTGPADDRPDQLGPDGRGARGRRVVGLGARSAGPDRRTHRAGRRHQALSAVPARPDPRGRLAGATAAGVPGGGRRCGGVVGVGQPARVAGRSRAVEGLLAVQLRAGGRPRLGVAGADPCRPPVHAAHGQPVVVGAVRGGVPAGRAARVDAPVVRPGWRSWPSWSSPDSCS